MFGFCVVDRSGERGMYAREDDFFRKVLCCGELASE